MVLISIFYFSIFCIPHIWFQSFRSMEMSSVRDCVGDSQNNVCAMFLEQPYED